MDKRYEVNVEILADKLEEVVKASGLTRQKLDTMVLNRAEGYISKSIRKGSMGEESFNKLCQFLDLNPDEYLRKFDTPVTPIYPQGEPKAPAAGSDVKLDTLIDLIGKQNELIKMEIAQEQAIERQMHSLMSALANIINNVVKLTDNIEVQEDAYKTIEEGINKVASGLNLANGRLKDICIKQNPRGGTQ